MEWLLFPVAIGAILAPALLTRGQDWLRRLAIGAALGVALWAALGLLRFFLLLPVSAPRTVGLACLTVAGVVGPLLIAVAIRASRPVSSHGTSASDRRLWLGIAATLLLTCGLEAAVPHFGGALRYYDWWMHFDLSRFYAAPSDLGRTYGENATVTSRTPLYNVLGAVALTLLGNRFSVLQVVTGAVGWLFILPLALLARRFSRDRAALTVAVAGLSPLILQSHTYTWPKGLAAFCALLAIERFIAIRAEALASRPLIALQLGLASGLTVMAHVGFAAYLVPVYCWLAWDCLHRRLPLRWLIASSVAAVLVALPWYGWAVAQYGLHQTIFGYPGSPYTSVPSWIVDHILIIVTAVVPVAIPANLLQDRGDLLQQYFIAYMGTAAGIFGLIFCLKVAAMNLHPKARLRTTADVMTIAMTGALIVTLLFEKPGFGWTGAGALFIPALLLLLLAALTSTRLTIAQTWVGLVEVLLFQIAILLWMWSPPSGSDLNAQLAIEQHIRFLGRDAWPLGVMLLAAGTVAAVAALRPWLGLSRQPAIEAQSTAA